MEVTIFSSVIKESKIPLPASKSLAHRAIICASLAKGVSVITNVDDSQDIQATIRCMRLLGASIVEKERELVIQGIQDWNQTITEPFYCQESGSTLRFMIPIASLTEQRVLFQGSKRLLERPQQVYADLFQLQHLFFQQDATGITIEGTIQSGDLVIPGNVSSQFISGLLFALPLKKEDSRIHITGSFESRSYVDLTLQMLQQFQIKAYFEDEKTIFIKGNQNYQAHDIRIEADYSQLAFWAVLSHKMGPLYLEDANPDSLQGDREILSILQKMGMTLRWEAQGVHCYPCELKAIEIDLGNCPDLGPILFVAASFAKGTTHFTHAKRLRIKESDRISVMEEELAKVGVQMTSTEDEVWVKGCDNWKGSMNLKGHNDHRIVMALSIGTLCSKQTCKIDGAEAIAKSYPTFFKTIEQCGMNIEIKN
ncbi:MAG: 3-phosphoshikimate 1-carboxyvinyltransferase [Erysipelotrichaceae bacterium]|nr:3-phosphoshikimate 1-carboxyvinyltransferase [Erysipelotrichaceae bacterium]